MNIVQIIPAQSGDSGTLQKTQGTRILLADGTQLEGVTGIVLTCNQSDVWRASINVVCRVPDLDRVLAQINVTAIDDPKPIPGASER